MIRAIVEFPSAGFLCTRWENSMRRYLPDDVQILQVLNRRTSFNHDEWDIVISLCPSRRLLPLLSFTSPKAVWTEAIDEVFLSRFSDKDLIITYEIDEVEKIESMGYNVIALPPPIDTEIFYPEHSDKIYDVMTLNVDGFGWAVKLGVLLNELKLEHLVMSRGFGQDIIADFDYCNVPTDNDRMRSNYCSTKYVVSFLSEREYYPGKWCVGWESGNAEGLLCGARPIFYKPDKVTYYDQWLGKWMEYIDKTKFVSELKRVLTGEYKPVTQDEIDEASSIFSAERVWGEFWYEVREVLR